MELLAFQKNKLLIVFNIFYSVLGLYDSSSKPKSSECFGKYREKLQLLTIFGLRERRIKIILLLLLFLGM